jgi:Spy/CpxP family protein refolding chaperone
LDIGRLFVQQLKMVLDSAAFGYYIPVGIRRNTMNRTRLLAIGTMLMLALTTVAQQATTNTSGPAKGVSSGQKAVVPTAAEQLTFLTGKLALTGDQQDRIKPILQELHDATVKVVQDESMSHDDRMSKLRDSHYKADAKIRAPLNDDQKKKLDQLEKEPHPELHGNINEAQK